MFIGNCDSGELLCPATALIILFIKIYMQTQGLHTFVEIDHEMISTVILPSSADLFKKGCCQLQAKV